MPEVPAEMLEGIATAVESEDVPAPVAINPETPQAPATPEGQAAEEAATDAPDSFTKLDPTSLPEEVQPYYKSMLADYTRKNQEAAPWRKLGEELGIDSPDAIREAATLYAYLQDADNLKSFYEQLGNALGTAPAATPAAEAQAVDEFASLDDPAVQQLRSEIQSVRQELAARDAKAAEDAQRWALLGEMNRQEAMLKEQHPDWGASDGDNMSDEWKAVWNLAPTFGGDLTAAAAHVEAVQNAAAIRLLNGKAQAASTEGLTPPAPSRIAAPAPPSVDGEDYDLKGPTAQAIEYLRGVVNASE